jgi:NTE family protein
MARIGLVLGAGGVTGGAFHAGVLSALVDATSWDARDAALIVGTSAGSAAGATLRAGLSPRDMAARARGEQLSAEGVALLQKLRLPIAPVAPPTGARLRFGRPAAPEALVAAMRRPWSVRPGSLASALLPAGDVPTDSITSAMDVMHPDGWPAAPLWVCAVRVSDGRLVVFGRDAHPSVGLAVAASCAIPSFFAPVEIDGARYVDGGAHSFCNVTTVAREELDLVVVSAPMARTIGRVQLRAEVDRVRRAGIPVVTFRPTPADEQAMGVNAMDPARRAPVTRQAYDSARARIDQLGGELDALRA